MHVLCVVVKKSCIFVFVMTSSGEVYDSLRLYEFAKVAFFFNKQHFFYQKHANCCHFFTKIMVFSKLFLVLCNFE